MDFAIDMSRLTGAWIRGGAGLAFQQGRVSGNFDTESLAMLESAVGAVGYVIRKLNQVRENVSSSQSRFEAIEIIEALILALVAVATAWSGYQAAQWAGKRAQIGRASCRER